MPRRLGPPTGYTHVFENKGGAYTRLDLQLGLRTGLWSPNRGCTHVCEYAEAFGSPVGATCRFLSVFRRLDRRLGLIVFWLGRPAWPGPAGAAGPQGGGGGRPDCPGQASRANRPRDPAALESVAGVFESWIAFFS